MKKEEILNLLEDSKFTEEQDYVSTIGKKNINVGRLSGMIYVPDLPIKTNPGGILAAK